MSNTQRYEIHYEFSAYMIAEAAKVMRKYGLMISGYSSNPHSQFFLIISLNSKLLLTFIFKYNDEKDFDLITCIIQSIIIFMLMYV
jgi:hypothetical protein